jgi:MFS family permease
VANPHFTFAGFFFIQNLPRGMLLSVIPLQALALTGNARDTSALLFAVSLGGVFAALIMPFVVKHLGARSTFLLSNAVMIFSAILMSFGTLAFFAVGIFFHIFSVASAEVVLSLYVMHKIPRKEITLFEPLRVLFSILALTIGPFLGVYLQSKIQIDLPYLLCAIFSLCAIVVFHRLRLHQIKIITTKVTTTSPLSNLSRYFKQPRLRLAYGLALARSSWWSMFVIYTPIYAIESGLGELTGAALVSIGTAWTLSVPFWGWCARRYGVKIIVLGGYVFNSTMTMLVFLVSDLPILAAGLLVVAALGATMLDGVGNVLFFRAVRSQDRSQMASVFVTYRDAAQLTTPGIYALLLNYFTLPIVFLTASGWMMTAAWFSRYVPKRLK